MFPHAQQYQQLPQQEVSINAPSMAQSTTDFSAPSGFGVNPIFLQAIPNLSRNIVPHNEIGQNHGGCGENGRDFTKPRKRGRGEEAEEGIATTAVHSNIPMTAGRHQTLLPSPNNISSGTGMSSFCNILYHPDDPDSDLSLRIQNDLIELDLFISAQMEKVREEMEQKRRRQWVGMARAVEDALLRAMRAKDEEIASVARRNSALEERVHALAMEGQMWRTLARTNEAAAAALRRDIELAQQVAAGGGGGGGGRGVLWEGEVEDSVSCCEGSQGDVVGECDGGWWRRQCRVCRRGEVSTLVLPCRHLCLCGDCDPATATCPLCGSHKSASIKVHLS